MKAFLDEALKVMTTHDEHKLCKKEATMIRGFIKGLKGFAEDYVIEQDTKDDRELNHLMDHGTRLMPQSTTPKTRTSRVSTILKPNDYEDKLDIRHYVGYCQHVTNWFAEFLK